MASGVARGGGVGGVSGQERHQVNCPESSALEETVQFEFESDSARLNLCTACRGTRG